MPRVSVIIPCFNYGAYIDEAVDSVLSQTYRDFEIIIVDDGSDDGETRPKLERYRKPATQVFFTSNMGVSMARNNAIAHASGEFILPLDADDRIHHAYLEKAVSAMDADRGLGIVYCKAAFFGERTDEWNLPEYSLERILLENMIFCSAMFRREDSERVGGYNASMKAGYEDWDFWLSLVGLGRKVYRIPEILFFYRQKQGSRGHKMTEEDRLAMHLQTINNHKELYSQNMLLWAKPLLERPSRNEYLEMRKAYLDTKEACLATKNAYIEMTNSMSWRLTQPLRSAAALIGAWGQALRRRFPRSSG